jgi:hypothetical protein
MWGGVIIWAVVIALSATWLAAVWLMFMDGTAVLKNGDDSFFDRKVVPWYQYFGNVAVCV